MANAKLDQNSRQTLTALSSANDGTIVELWADPTTHALLTDISGTVGTVTSVSVVSANGFAGTVATATSTPAITLSTTITGILSGNGTAISAASTTGSGSVVLSGSPALTTPSIAAITVSGGIMTLPTGSSDTLVGKATTDTLTNKTMTGATNTLTASLLKSATTEVNVSSATAPSSGQVLTATSSTAATWQTPAATGANTALSNLAAVAINTSLLPGTDDGAALGSTTKEFSDLFLASGGVINWAAGDVTITHSANRLSFDGASSGYGFDSTVQVINTAGVAANIYSYLDTPTSQIASFAANIGTVADGNEGYISLQVRNDASTLADFARITWTATDINVGTGMDGALAFSVVTAGSMAKEVVLNGTSFSPFVSDGNALGTGSLMWSDLFLASGGVINFNNGNITLTHSAGNLTLDGGTFKVNGASQINTTLMVGDNNVSAQNTLHVYGGVPLATVGGTQMILESYFNGYGAGVSFQSRTSSGGTLVEMARIVSDGEGPWSTTASTQDANLKFFTTEDGSASEKMRITANGNLLVGTTSQVYSEKLAVQKDQNSATYQLIRNNNSGSSAASAITLNAYGNSWGMEIGSAAKNSNALTFSVDYLGTPVEKMRLDTTGNLFVGGSSTAALDGIFGCVIGGSSKTNAGVAIESSSSQWLTYTTDASQSLLFWDSRQNAERMRLDASGNLGLGTTPSAWISSAKVLDFVYPSVGMSNSGAGFLAFNAYVNSGGNWIYKSTDEANRFVVDIDGSFSWYTAPSGTAGNTITFTQAMTLSASSNLTVATSVTTPQVFNAMATATVTANAATITRANRNNKFVNSSAAAMTITLSTASAAAGDMLLVQIYDFSAATQTITWVNTENSTVTVPATSNGSTTLPLTVGFMWNASTSKWRIMFYS